MSEKSQNHQEDMGEQTIMGDDIHETFDEQGELWLTTKKNKWEETTVYDHKNKIERKFDKDNRFLYKEEKDRKLSISYKGNSDSYGTAKVVNRANYYETNKFHFAFNKIEENKTKFLIFVSQSGFEPEGKTGDWIDLATEISKHKEFENFLVMIERQDKQTGYTSWTQVFEGKTDNTRKTNEENLEK